MAKTTTLTIPEIDDRFMERLKERAERHGRSVADETRAILRSTVGARDPNRKKLTRFDRERFGLPDGFEFERPPAELVRDPPDFS